MSTKRWLDATTLVLGLYLLFVPLFTLESAGGATIWVAEVAGIAVAVIAGWALAQPGSVAAEWTQVAAGALLFVAPFVFSYTELTGAMWNALVVGAGVAVLALSAVPAANQLATGIGAPSGGAPSRGSAARR